MTRLPLRALAATLLCAAGAAHASPYVVQQSSPVYWGSTGAVGVLELYYDLDASGPLTVLQPMISDIGGANTTLVVLSCGTPRKSGDSITGYVLQPGQLCYYRILRTGASVVGSAAVSDATANTSNISAYLRGSLEIRDANENVLTHTELK